MAEIKEQNLINGVRLYYLNQIPDERGMVKHFMVDDGSFHFGEAYFSEVYKGVIKGFHGYTSKMLNYCVPLGMVHLVLWDSRPESRTYNVINEFHIGEQNYMRVVIPAGVMNAFRGIADPYSLVAILASEKFDESRTIRMEIDDPKIPYKWTK